MDRIDDAVVGAAAAEIAAHPLAQLVVTERYRLRLEIRSDVTRHALAKLGRHADRRADLTGRAIAALEPVMFDKRLLQRMERAGGAEALDRCDLAAFVLHGQSEAGIDALTGDQDGAGAARSLIASLLCSKKVKMFAQEIEKRRSHVHFPLHFAAIHNPAHRVLRLIQSAGLTRGRRSCSIRTRHHNTNTWNTVLNHAALAATNS